MHGLFYNKGPNFCMSRDVEIHIAVSHMFKSLIPANVVNALATDSLLAVLVSSVIVRYLI